MSYVGVPELSSSPRAAGAAEGRTYRILSTFPPTACGVATFSAALATGLVANGATVEVVRVADGTATDEPSVVAELAAGSPSSMAGAVEALDDADVAVVQHEYGIYGGRDGEEVVDVLRRLTTPAIVVAHTVRSTPTAHQKAVLEAVVAAASAVVVMTDAGRTRLCGSFAVDPSKVVMIPHGAATPLTLQADATTARRPVLLSWGLLGPGKGLEWAIDAMALLKDLRPRPRYVIAGDTHPKVKARKGEAYRSMLVARAWRAGVASMVEFEPGYRTVPQLSELLRGVTAVVLPYDSRDQVTSGVLVDAVAAGRPVVSTGFPHAVELLSSGAGLIVERRDPVSLAAALRRVLTEPGLAAAMGARAAELAPALGWSAVAADYATLADGLLAGRAAVPA